MVRASNRGEWLGCQGIVIATLGCECQPRIVPTITRGKGHTMANVNSSHGTIEVDTAGKVTGVTVNGQTGSIKIELEGKNIKPTASQPIKDLAPLIISAEMWEGVQYLLSIKRFNLEEYNAHYGVNDHTEFDILDVGYWTRDGVYEEPVHSWRAQIGEELAEREKGRNRFNSNGV